MKVIGSRERTLLANDGSEKILIIRRLRCKGCGRIHHELPDIVIPYKRYDAQTIENILSGKEEHLDDYPCELSTAKRLKLWFYLLRNYFESTLHALRFLFTGEGTIRLLLPLLPLSGHFTGWLKALVRYTVNSGRWVQTRSA